MAADSNSSRCNRIPFSEIRIGKKKGQRKMLKIVAADNMALGKWWG